MSGCADARTIITVNGEPDTPIFDYPSLGVVADCREPIPALTAAIRELSDQHAVAML